MLARARGRSPRRRSSPPARPSGSAVGKPPPRLTIDSCDAALGAARGRSPAAGASALVPGVGSRLLRADVERHAIGVEARAGGHARSTSTAIAGAQPNLRDSGHSAPAPSVRMRQNTRAPGAARAIFSTSSTQSTANSRTPSAMGARDVALLLDGVAEGDAVGRGAGRERHLDLGDRGGVEARAERGEQRQHLRRRIGLHRVEDAACRAAPWRRRCSCRARRRDRRRGRARRRCAWRRKSRMRSVMVHSRKQCP